MSLSKDALTWRNQSQQGMGPLAVKEMGALNSRQTRRWGIGGAGLCLIEDAPDLFLCTSRSGSRTAEPSGGSGKSAGAEAASWPSMDSTGPWCATPFPCQSPSSSPPRTASWTPVPRGCWVRARTLPGVLPLGRGEWAPEEGDKALKQECLVATTAWRERGPRKLVSQSPLEGAPRAGCTQGWVSVPLCLGLSLCGFCCSVRRGWLLPQGMYPPIPLPELGLW